MDASVVSPQDQIEVAVATEKPDRFGFVIEAVVAVCGVALAVAALALPWFNLEDTSITSGAIVITGPAARTGYDTAGIFEANSTTPFGWVVIACGVLAVLLLVVRRLRPSISARLTGGAPLVIAAVALAATAYTIVNPAHFHYGNITITSAPVESTPGGGLLLALVAGAVMAACGLVAIVRMRERKIAQGTAA